jgi:DNA-binding NtrC family response regulator
VHFLDLLNRAHGTKKEWAPDAAARLEKREWKGNVRELKNAVYRAFILADDVLVEETAIAAPPEEALVPGSPLTGRVGASIADVERTLILSTLEFTNGDKPAAAKILGISLKTLYSRLSLYRAAAS